MTATSDLYSQVRALLNDATASPYAYSDAAIDRSFLTAVDMRNAQFYGDESYSCSGGAITPDLPDAMVKWWFIIKGALMLLAGQDGDLRYTTRVISVATSRADIARRKAYLEELLSDVEGGTFPVAVFDDVNKLEDALSLALGELKSAAKLDEARAVGLTFPSQAVDPGRQRGIS